MNQATSFVVAAGALALAGCASRGPVTSTAPSASPANGAATASAATQTDKNFKPPADYRRVVMNGQVEYCRKYWPTGTHAESHTECFTEDQLKEIEESNRNSLEDSMRARQSVPGGIAPAGLGH